MRLSLASCSRLPVRTPDRRFGLVLGGGAVSLEEVESRRHDEDGEGMNAREFHDLLTQQGAIQVRDLEDPDLPTAGFPDHLEPRWFLWAVEDE